MPSLVSSANAQQERSTPIQPPSGSIPSLGHALSIAQFPPNNQIMTFPAGRANGQLLQAYLSHHLPFTGSVAPLSSRQITTHSNQRNAADQGESSPPQQKKNNPIGR